MIKSVLEKYRDRFGDIFDFKITNENAMTLDFSKGNELVTTEIIERSDAQEEFVFGLIRDMGARVGVGGYLEDRKLYQRGVLFDNDVKPRSVHLGIDLWIEAGTSVFAPIEGVVFSVKNNEGTGDYGPTIILEHHIEGLTFYTLYGHLSEHALTINAGDRFALGQKLCEIGNFPINGDWAPHLHFQILTNLDDFNDGDYPAVCTEEDLVKFSNYCPNPNLILRIAMLD